MADDQEVDLIPDHGVLAGILPEISSIPESDYSIQVISTDPDCCTFRLSFTTTPRLPSPPDLLIRLETAPSHLPAVAELQRLAHGQIPELVPVTLAVGSVTNAAGKRLDYTVIPFLTDTVVLEDVWTTLDENNQASLIDSLVEALRRLQSLPATPALLRQIINHDSGHLEETTSSQDLNLTIGGPNLEYHAGLKDVLAGLINGKATATLGCEVIDTANGITTRTAQDGTKAAELTQSDLTALMANIVLCHNDLEPRNILVRKTEADNAGEYKLAAIIDWEMAGFYPFSYEYGLKDTFLGSNNLYFGWYSLFKQRAAALLPAGAAQEKLIQALAVIDHCNSQAMPKNVGVCYRKKWLQRERLVMSPERIHGWVREEGATDIPVFSKEDNTALETEVLRELGKI